MIEYTEQRPLRCFYAFAGYNSQKMALQRLAGNSIVVSCMFHIFRKLFIEKGNENQQLELF